MANKKLDGDLSREKPLHPKQQIAMSLPIPPSVNHMYITTGYSKTLTKKAKDYVAEVQRICTEAIKKHRWKEDHPSVWYVMDLYFYFPDKKIRDSHNCIKLLMDSLEGILFPNDYYVKPRIQAVELSRDNPKLDLVFYPDTERWE